MFFSQWLFQPVVLRREIVVSVWERPQGDDNRLDDLRSLQPGNTLTPSHVPVEHINPPFFTPPFPLLQYPQPPATPPPTPHPRLLLHMNNGRGLLDRRYQHAVACFIHTRVRQNSPRRCPDPWATRPPRHQHQLGASARSVSLTCASLLRRATPLFNGSAELQVNIWI